MCFFFSERCFPGVFFPALSSALSHVALCFCLTLSFFLHFLCEDNAAFSFFFRPSDSILFTSQCRRFRDRRVGVLFRPLSAGDFFPFPDLSPLPPNR